MLQFINNKKIIYKWLKRIIFNFLIILFLHKKLFFARKFKRKKHYFTSSVSDVTLIVIIDLPLPPGFLNHGRSLESISLWSATASESISCSNHTTHIYAVFLFSSFHYSSQHFSSISFLFMTCPRNLILIVFIRYTGVEGQKLDYTDLYT